MAKIVNIIGWVGTALVVVAFALSQFSTPYAEYQRYLAWAGLALVLVYLAGQWRDVVTFYQGRGAKYGTMSIVSIIVFIAILVAVNYLGTRQNKRWDFTANQVYSLSDQTVKVLKDLKEPVKFTVFDRETNFDRFRDRLDEFAYHSSQVQTEYVDPDREPGRAKAAQLQSYGTVLVEYAGRTERVTSTEEQALTNALIKAVTGAAKKVYFTQGHGEKDIAGTDRIGMSSIGQALTADNFETAPLVLAQQKDGVPADATVVVIAGPQTDFFPPEMDAVKAYVARGGKVLVLLDPVAKAGGAGYPLLTQFLMDWGINAGNDIVLDASGMGRMLGTDASVPVAAQYPPHAITEGFALLTAYPFARSMTAVEGGSNGHIAQPLVNTSAQSWAEMDVASLSTGKVAFDADKGDRQGPISLGAAVSAPATDVPAPPSGNGSPASPDSPPKPESRVVGIGDSEFAANAGVGIQGNRDFFMNAINWLAQQENLIAIRPREPEDRRLTLTADQQNRIMILCLFIIPGLVFASGVYTWWRRR
jgi:ABC-type uncharacterized transport system involved in gliding motility auxiliary subunit